MEELRHLIILLFVRNEQLDYAATYYLSNTRIIETFESERGKGPDTKNE